MTTETPLSRPATSFMAGKEKRENNAWTFVHRLEAFAPCAGSRRNLPGHRG